MNASPSVDCISTHTHTHTHTKKGDASNDVTAKTQDDANIDGNANCNPNAHVTRKKSSVKAKRDPNKHYLSGMFRSKEEKKKKNV